MKENRYSFCNSLYVVVVVERLVSDGQTLADERN